MSLGFSPLPMAYVTVQPLSTWVSGLPLTWSSKICSASPEGTLELAMLGSKVLLVPF